MTEKKEVKSVRLRPSLMQKVKAEADKRGISFNALVEKALERELEPPAKTRAKQLGAALRAPVPPPAAKGVMWERQERLNKERGKK